MGVEPNDLGFFIDGPIERVIVRDEKVRDADCVFRRPGYSETGDVPGTGFEVAGKAKGARSGFRK